MSNSNRRSQSYEGDDLGRREIPHRQLQHRKQRQTGARTSTVEASERTELLREIDVGLVAVMQQRSLTSHAASLRSLQEHDIVLLRRIEEEKKSIRLRMAELEVQKQRIMEDLPRNRSSLSIDTFVSSRHRDAEDFLSLSSTSDLSARRRSILQERMVERGGTARGERGVGRALTGGFGSSARNTEVDLFHGQAEDSSAQSLSLGSIARGIGLYEHSGMATDSRSSGVGASRGNVSLMTRGSSFMDDYERSPKRSYQADPMSRGPLDEGKRAKKTQSHYGEPTDRHVPGVALAVPSDSDLLSPYQILLRESLEYFLASEDDIHTSQKGRKRKIKLGQVGIRCRYCAHLHPSVQTNGASTFPRAKESIYMCAQNIAMAHMVVAAGREHDVCTSMPKEILKSMTEKKASQSASSVGVDYWAKQGCACNLKEEDGALWLK